MGSYEPSITVLTEYFYPEEASTAQLLTELTAGLADDFDVSVLTAYPNYHRDDQTQSVPGRATHRSVEIQRVRATRFDKDYLPLRVLNWLSFTLLILWRLVRREENGILLVLSNPPILPFAAWANKRICGDPYAYLVYDIYPDMPIQLGVIAEDGPIASLWERAMRHVYRDADRIVVLGESMQQTIVEKMADDLDFDPDKIEIIPNWEDTDFIEPIDKSDNDFAREHGTVDVFTLLYSGNIGRFHDLETAIDAIGHLENRGRTDIQLLIIGEGAKKADLKARVRRRDIDNVSFLPFQPLDRLPETLTCGDASLVTVEQGVEGLCVSSKLYSSLAAGRPILALVGKEDEVARVVRDCECGVRMDQGSPEAVADVLERWADDPGEVARLGRNARQCIEQRYTRTHAVEAYRELFAELAA